MTCTKRYGCESLTILWHQKWINILYRKVCILYVHYINTLQVRMSTSGEVIRFIGWGFQSSNPKEIQWFKWEFYIQFVWHLSGMYPWHKTRPACITDLKVIFCQYCNNGAHAIHCCISLHCVKFNWSTVIIRNTCCDVTFSHTACTRKQPQGRAEQKASTNQTSLTETISEKKRKIKCSIQTHSKLLQ